MRQISITIPHDKSLGKNAAHEYRGGGKTLDVVDGKLVAKSRSTVRKNKTTNANQNGIFLKVRGECNKQTPQVVFEKRKLTVAIHVVRPVDPEIVGARKDIDPANFQPTIIDAVEKGIHVDDSFYETSVTWSVVKKGEKPVITITITQKDKSNG